MFCAYELNQMCIFFQFKHQQTHKITAYETLKTNFLRKSENALPDVIKLQNSKWHFPLIEIELIAVRSSDVITWPIRD